MAPRSGRRIALLLLVAVVAPISMGSAARTSVDLIAGGGTYRYSSCGFGHTVQHVELGARATHTFETPLLAGTPSLSADLGVRSAEKATVELPPASPKAPTLQHDMLYHARVLAGLDWKWVGLTVGALGFVEDGSPAAAPAGRVRLGPRIVHVSAAFLDPGLAVQAATMRLGFGTQAVGLHGTEVEGFLGFEFGVSNRLGPGPGVSLGARLTQGRLSWMAHSVAGLDAGSIQFGAGWSW